MNQYRCETCKHLSHAFKDKGMPSDCNILDHWLTDCDRKTINCVGCASHSDFQNRYVNIKIDQPVKNVGDRCWFVRVKDGDIIKIYPELGE
jgi:hypothetical protein